jgi:rhodanese-related sulfurtransferase
VTANLWARRVGMDRITGYLHGGMTAWATAGLRTPTSTWSRPKDLHDRVTGTSNIVLVDVRAPLEFEDSHISGAVNIPAPDLRTRHVELDPDKPTFVMCSSGNRSSLAASILKQHGFKEVHNVAGGMTGYSAAGYAKECVVCENPHGSRFFAISIPGKRGGPGGPDHELATSVRWSPYAVGIGIGVLELAHLAHLHKPIGCSTSFARSAGMIEKLFRGQRAEARPYYQEVKPVVDWQWMLVLGMIVGALISSRLSGDFSWQWIPPQWAAAFGTSVLLRLVVRPPGRRPPGLWRPLGRRLHQRARHQRHHATGRLQLDLGHLLLHRRHPHGPAPLCRDRRLRGGGR